jgi:hypothetical protein
VNQLVIPIRDERNKRSKPKGRAVDPQALAEVRALLKAELCAAATC